MIKCPHCNHILKKILQAFDMKGNLVYEVWKCRTPNCDYRKQVNAEDKK